MDEKTQELVERMLSGDQGALARLITQVENRDASAPEIIRRIHPRTGRAYVVGVTGPPGAGKSSLVDRLTALLRQGGASVGVIAVDPSSQFTGGAVLGDRIRMQQHTLDAGVFIRSMATRGKVGGLARATADTIKLLDAFGKDWVLVETVGVGQTELDIARQADTTVVVLTPESGDAVQMMKAGLLEVADLFVVNKADRPGADPLITELKFMVHLHLTGLDAPRDVEWEIPVLSAEAIHNRGVEELLVAIQDHRRLLESTRALESRRQARRRQDVQELLVQSLHDTISQALRSDPRLAAILDQVSRGEKDSYSAVAELFSHLDLPNPRA
ncbi:MAG TPA: methylmalonyl Co-A mutase-associated GTPase MeaB [Methylomirabilota bacterium]|nr:methylmalonyl Co-A mutase-associated GTPase MeaB [Methylomirabilota bacterium]